MSSEKKIITIYAGESGRRIASLNSVGLDVLAIGGGNEEDTHEVMKVTRDKVNYAMTLILKGMLDDAVSLEEKQNDKREIIVAADARTETFFKMPGTEVFDYFSYGKPNTEQEVKDHFANMLAAQDSLGKRTYRLRASSMAVNLNSGTSIGDTEICNVVFTEDALGYLASDVGFAAYLQAFDDFYKSESYASEDLKPITVGDISSGISFPVLVKMGLVEGVFFGDSDQEGGESPFDEMTFKKALYVVGVGFAPRVLEYIQEGLTEKMMAWAWLQKVYESVLND